MHVCSAGVRGTARGTHLHLHVFLLRLQHAGSPAACGRLDFDKKVKSGQAKKGKSF